ncbi:von Willebrand factor A domain-containing protein 7 isoform X1 [Nelusetta ayraudi]|uniref:von Willebrand factor A domain-containing protein 7 isoform X1 n=1 Tax=Nelusetta ayraudi TaxID=303726 RepID=UPI003F6F3A3E
MSGGRRRRGSLARRRRLVHSFLPVHLLLLPLLLASPCTGFLPNFWSQFLTLPWKSVTHQHITERSVVNVTLESLAATEQQVAGQKSPLGRGFWRAVGEVVQSNADMDFLSSTKSDPVYHFDSERVDEAAAVLRQLWAQTLLSVRARQYQSARRSLGQLCHSLQDFYSHSNWVEMGERSLYRHLLQPEEPAVPVAPENTATCMECFSATCRGNLLPTLANGKPGSKLLTTGYFGSDPPKPPGKCSHGGILDQSRSLEAKGGINKDSGSPLFSPHHYLHQEAARLAGEATLSLLLDLRDTVSHKTFLRLFSVGQAPALVFVMDTTGSMFEEITAARLRAHSIIQSRASGAGEPSSYVLVPFHDPKVGPVYETEDPNQFMQSMENLLALGGGDEPEMCLTAVQVALTHSPPLSEIFVFTDASPKDAHLFDAVKALALEKQSKVSFLLTEDPSYAADSRGRSKRRRRRRRSGEPLSPDRFSLYSSLSSLSGGLTVFTTNSDIQAVSTIVEDCTALDKVTLLHVVSEEEESLSSHYFKVDALVENVTLLITGALSECKLSSPSEQSQSLPSERGPLAEMKSFKGLSRINLLLPIEAGQWKLQVKSDGHLTFNVLGASPVDFLYHFATVANETHPGLARVEGSPVADVPTFLVLTVTGLPQKEEVSFSHVMLLGAHGEKLQTVELNSSSSSSLSSFFPSVDQLVGRVDPVPKVPFCVQLTGRDNAGNKFERVSTELVHPTHVQIQVKSPPRLVPGHSTMVDFEVLNHGPARLFSLAADDDRGYLHKTGPQRFFVTEYASFSGRVELRTPATAQPGVTVSLTLTARALGSPDLNYAVAYLTVVSPDSDMSLPSCSITQVNSSCSSVCNESSWNVSLAVSDSGRSSLAALQLQKGEGVLTLFLSPPAMEESPVDGQLDPEHQHQHQHQQAHHGEHMARLKAGDAPFNVSAWPLGSSQPLWGRYTSSCCSSQAELLVWNTAGNMKRCHLTSGQQGQQRDHNAEASGVGHTEFVSYFMFFWTVFLLCCPFL